MKLVDASTWLGHWPFGELEPDTAAELVAHQGARGIARSCVASLDAVFYQDPRSANERLARQVADHPLLEMVAVVNPALANWPDQLAATLDCSRQIRLVPNYHGYRLTDPGAEQLLAAAHDAGLRVSIQIRLEDERAHHPLMKVPAVPVDDVLAAARRRPAQKLLVMAPYRGEALRLGEQANLLVEYSHIESQSSLDDLLAALPTEQVVFGSHTPFFVTLAAIAKLETSRADESTLAAVAGGNLERWLSD